MFHSLSIRDVSLLGGEFCRRRELVREYLASFDTDRLLHSFRLNAGLPSEAEPLGGWESPDCGVRGHFAGHFLSACARFAYADGDERLRRQTQAVVAGLRACARPSGYLSAFPEEVLDTLEREEDRGVWAPYYTLHKLLQGLLDCARLLGDQTALDLACGLARYVGERFAGLSYWKIDGILRCARPNPVNEFGGMGDALYQLHELTGDSSFLKTAKLFDREYFLAPLARGEDILTDLHANTHLPMILAACRRYEQTGEERFREAALRFYSFLCRRCFANGNTSSRAAHPVPGQVSETSEHWGASGVLANALTGGESESCCAHNTERILEHLFAWTGDAALLRHLAVLKYGAVLNSASPETGLSQYHQPMGEGVRKRFSGAYDTFWCCTASGVEAMSELQKNLWLTDESETSLILNLFIPSRACLWERGVTLTLETAYPDGDTARVTVRTERPASLRLLLRAERVSAALVNGEPAALTCVQGFAVLEREWKDGDVLALTLSSPISLLPLPDDGTRAAVLCGDVLLAQKGRAALPALREEGPEKALRRARAGEACFVCETADGAQAELVPLYAIGEEEYTVYSRLTREAAEASSFSFAQDGSAAY